jgi:hypothetical protein
MYHQCYVKRKKVVSIPWVIDESVRCRRQERFLSRTHGLRPDLSYIVQSSRLVGKEDLILKDSTLFQSVLKQDT